MSDKWYNIEKLEGTEWVIKCRTNFEDVDQFKEITKCPSYRIMLEGQDVTSRYNENYTKLPDVHNPQSVKVVDNPAMKPSQYKSLSKKEQTAIVKHAMQLRKDSYRRSDILQMLNVTESTYDLIIKEITVNAETANTTNKIATTDSEKPSNNSIHTLKRGLFAKI